jgi:outer membrane biosynthesis protein TonB
MIGRAPIFILVAFGLGLIPSMTISCKKEEPAPAAQPAASEDEDKPKKKKKKVEEEEDEEAPKPSASPPASASSSAPTTATATATVKKPAGTSTGLTKTDAGPPPLFTIPTNIIPSGLPTIPTFPPPQ